MYSGELASHSRCVINRLFLRINICLSSCSMSDSSSDVFACSFSLQLHFNEASTLAKCMLHISLRGGLQPPGTPPLRVGVPRYLFLHLKNLASQASICNFFWGGGGGGGWRQEEGVTLGPAKIGVNSIISSLKC